MINPPLHQNIATLTSSSSSSSSITTTISSASKSSASTTTTAAVLPPIPFRTYNTAKDLPISYYKNQKSIRGRVVKVIDGDTIRIRHTPLYPFQKGRNYKNTCRNNNNNNNNNKSNTKKKPLLSECTISIRLYGIDTPETAKRGNPGQPYSQEATSYTSQQVLDQIVNVKILRKDQYSRVVGRVTTKRNNLVPFLKKDLSTGLAEKGYAVLYKGGGAEYDGKRDLLEGRIERAKRKKIGMWSSSDVVDPAMFKREMKARKNEK